MLANESSKKTISEPCSHAQVAVENGKQQGIYAGPSERKAALFGLEHSKETQSPANTNVDLKVSDSIAFRQDDSFWCKFSSLLLIPLISKYIYNGAGRNVPFPETGKIDVMLLI